MEQQFSTDKAPKPVGLYPHARRAGNLLFLSGVGPRKAGTDEIPGLEVDKHGNHKAFDFEAQCRSVFDNVRVILEESGSSWDKLIDVTVFLVDMKRDFHTYNRVYA
ncbi:MAG: RidA family protein, partial [Bacteroidetes bacterium]|nr:RidA family protein [Bacteroidota bacterium]